MLEKHRPHDMLLLLNSVRVSLYRQVSACFLDISVSLARFWSKRNLELNDFGFKGAWNPKNRGKPTKWSTSIVNGEIRALLHGLSDIHRIQNCLIWKEINFPNHHFWYLYWISVFRYIYIYKPRAGDKMGSHGKGPDAVRFFWGWSKFLSMLLQRWKTGVKGVLVGAGNLTFPGSINWSC